VKLDIRAKLVLVSVGLIAASLFVLEIYLRPLIEEEIVAGKRADLFAHLAVLERQVAPLAAHPGPAAEWDRLADDLGRRADLRVTLIDTNGAVLGDSDVPAADLAAVENHRDRSEVASALRGGKGFGTRFSVTVNRPFVYAAIPVMHDGKVVAVARVAQPLEQLERAVRRLRRTLTVGAILALGVAIFMSTVAAQIMSRALRGITRAARRMSAGDLAVRTRIGGADEVGELGRTLDGLAENLSSTLAALRAERDLFGRMLEAMQEGVLVLDREGRILLVNLALREMLLLGADIMGRTPIEAVRNAELQAILDRATSSQRPASGEVEIGGIRPRRFMVHATPLEGEPRGQVAVFVDLTEIRRLETMRKDFVANVSHELRTPITAVRSAAETLKRTLARDPDAAVRFVDMIERNACRLQELVEDLLDLSRIESREYRPQVEPVEMGPAIQQVLALFADAAREKQLRLETALPEGPAAVVADRRAVEQVLTNLVENAVKYCPPGSSITVRAVVRDDIARISVQDTGHGIEPQHLPRLFERFYRADKGRSRDMGGTGLGLSIVKHLVEAMDGTVGVESTLGKGTTFSFTLPTRTAVADRSSGVDGTGGDGTGGADGIDG
jgi:two-component system, OmpR family, phosphate regulon sensor histidine kinase PhoR